MKNANKKKWSDMTKKERFWKIFGLVIRLLALAAALAVTISLWVSARCSTPLSASAESVIIPAEPGYSNYTVYALYQGDSSGPVGSSGIFQCDSYGSSSILPVLEKFESDFKQFYVAGSFYPLNVYLFNNLRSEGVVKGVFFFGANLGNNHQVSYIWSSFILNWDFGSQPTGPSYVYPILSGFTTSLRSPLSAALTPYLTSDSGFNISLPSYNTSSSCNLACSFASYLAQPSSTPLPDIVYQVVDIAGNSYETAYQSGYQSGYSQGRSDGYSSGFAAGESSSAQESYDSGYSAGQSAGYASGYVFGKDAGYDSGYDDGLAAGQQADKNVNLDWVINSVGGLFNIKMGTGPNALTFGDIVFTMVSISIFGGVLKLFFGG